MLEWHLRWGGYAKVLAKVGVEAANTRNCPRLRPDLLPIWDAFQRLHTHRQGHGNGPNPLSISEINAYFQVIGLTNVEVRLEYLDLISSLDACWMTWAIDKITSEATTYKKQGQEQKSASAA